MLSFHKQHARTICYDDYSSSNRNILLMKNKYVFQTSDKLIQYAVAMNH
jgi:hypothetical protein